MVYTKAIDVIKSLESNIYCGYTFNRGIRDFIILKRILTSEEAKVLSTLLVEVDPSSPDVLIGKSRSYNISDVFIMTKYLKEKYKENIITIQEKISHNEIDHYWGDCHCSYSEALEFIGKIE